MMLDAQGNLIWLEPKKGFSPFWLAELNGRVLCVGMCSDGSGRYFVADNDNKPATVTYETLEEAQNAAVAWLRNAIGKTDLEVYAENYIRAGKALAETLKDRDSITESFLAHEVRSQTRRVTDELTRLQRLMDEMQAAMKKD